MEIRKSQAITIFTELHSEEVQEIISRPPQWLVRSGITLSLVLLLILFSGCWLIKYPDIIPTSFILTAIEAPRVIVTKSEGKLQRLLVRDGQRVSKNDLLAFGESTASHEQILKLSADIERFKASLGNENWEKINDLQISEYNQLGEIQVDFQIFTQKLAELKTFLNGGFYQDKRNFLTRDIADLQALEMNLSEQLDLQKRDLELGADEFKVQEKLYENKVIAPLEYKKEKSKLLSREMPVKNLQSLLIQNRTSQTAKQKEILELDNLITEHKNSFQQTLQTLISNIESWKQRYILTAPIEGRISFAAPWQEQQHIGSGEIFVTIEPNGTGLEGLVKIPQANIGKINDGQLVLIKLDGYPYREYGMLEGKLKGISATTDRDSSYWGYVELPHQLNTKYGRRLSYKNGLRGTAEIVTADRVLAERFLSAIRNGRN